MNLYIFLNIFIKLLESNLFFGNILPDISANESIEKDVFNSAIKSLLKVIVTYSASLESCFVKFWSPSFCYIPSKIQKVH